jgi:hypothetical protein
MRNLSLQLFLLFPVFPTNPNRRSCRQTSTRNMTTKYSMQSPNAALDFEAPVAFSLSQLSPVSFALSSDDRERFRKGVVRHNATDRWPTKDLTLEAFCRGLVYTKQ